MKQKFILFAFVGLFAASFIGCEPKNPPVDPGQTDTIPTDTIPTDTIQPFTASFPKKHLIEEFTGQGCGYCPYGMDCIHDFMGEDTTWVLILHHYGYQADHFSVSGSKTITSALGVSGAPSMAIDRKKTNYGDGNSIVFHPGYLPNTSKSQFEQETYASIAIANTYDKVTRELHIKVSGVIGKPEHEQLFLTVLVKESGMIDTQADYYNTFEGWKEFRHTNAVRLFLTAAKGDSVHADNQHYTADYTATLKDSWVAENCMVVAFLSEKTYKPVIQAEQRPVVAGTQGGADIQHGGITPVPVSDYYPEPNASYGPSNYTNNKFETLTVTQAWYEQYDAYTYWQLQTYSTKTITISGSACIPFAFLYLFTEPGTNTIAEGTYEINTSEQPGTVLAGYRIDDPQSLGGSEFYLTDYEYFQQGYLYPMAEWLIAEGTMEITSTGWTLNGKARNGSAISLKGTTPIQNKGAANGPKKLQIMH